MWMYPCMILRHLPVTSVPCRSIKERGRSCCRYVYLCIDAIAICTDLHGRCCRFHPCTVSTRSIQALLPTEKIANRLVRMVGKGQITQLGTDTCVDMRVRRVCEACVCVDISAGMCAGVRAAMCVDLRLGARAWTCVCRLVRRHAHRHMRAHTWTGRA